MKNNKSVGDIRIGAFVNWPIFLYDLDFKRVSDWERPLFEKDKKPKTLKKVNREFISKRVSKRNV